MQFDVVIVGGGPAGLQAALTLGRARKRVLLCDAGPRRNAAAVHMHNFLTRDGTPPAELRALAREQLASYPSVSFGTSPITSITGARGAFQVHTADGVIDARRILLATGMVDEPPPIEGLRALWGSSIVQCPYCHGWEVQDRRWGYLALPGATAHAVPFTTMLRGWSRDVTLFTGAAVDLPAEGRAQLAAAGVKVETAAITRVLGQDGQLTAVELADGRPIACDVLFSHPPQRQVDLVRGLGLALDGEGFVRVEPLRCETSVPGIYAAGDLTTRGQAAILAAAAGMLAAAALNTELTMQLAAEGHI